MGCRGENKDGEGEERKLDERCVAFGVVCLNALGGESSSYWIPIRAIFTRIWRKRRKKEDNVGYVFSQRSLLFGWKQSWAYNLKAMMVVCT